MINGGAAVFFRRDSQHGILPHAPPPNLRKQMYPQQTTMKQAIKNARKMGNKKPSAGERLLERAYKLLAEGKKKK